MVTKIVRLGLFVALAGALSACATSPTPPPEPNMKHLVPVNTSWPPPVPLQPQAKNRPAANSAVHAKDKEQEQGDAR